MVLLKSGSRVITNAAAASPILMPLRFAEKGLAMPSESTSSEAKPLIVSGDRVSAPPQITASARLARSSLAALIRARAPEVQAVETA